MGGPVLILDGDPTFTQGLQAALASRGHQVEAVEEANLDLVRDLRPSVLVLSAELPRSSGFSFCSRVRHDRELRTTPILLLSAASSEEVLNRHAARPERANAYARKPLSPQRALGLVEQLMGAAPPPLARAKDTPPPLPKSNNAVPRSNSALPRSGSVVPLSSESALPRSRPGVPPLGEADEAGRGGVWPRERFTSVLEAPVTSDLDAGSRRLGREDRVDQLRTLVKRHEARERQVQDLVREMNERGEELARRASGLDAQLQASEGRVTELEGERAALQNRLEDTEASFRNFHDDVTRIFTEKDAEEAKKAEAKKNQDEALAQLQTELAAAREQVEDDRRRLVFLDEELESSQKSLEVRAAEISTLNDELGARGRELENLSSKLAAVEGVAEERADLIAELEDRLDTQASSHAQSLARAEAQQEETLAAARRASDARETQLGTERAALVAAQGEELASLRQSHASAVAALEAEHASALTEASARTHHIESEWTAKLQTAEATHAATLEETEGQHRSREDDLKARLQAQERLTETLERDLVLVKGELGESRDQADVNRTNAEAWQTRAENAERQFAAAEAEVEEARENIVALRDELDRARDGFESLRQERETLATALEASDVELQSTLSELRGAIDARERASAAHQALSAQLAETEQARSDESAILGELRAALETACGERDRAAADAAEQSRRAEALTVELRTVRTAQLEGVEAERVALEAEQANLRSERDALRESRDAARADAEAALTRAEAQRAELETYRGSAVATLERLEANLKHATRDQTEAEALAASAQQLVDDERAARAAAEARIEALEKSVMAAEEEAEQHGEKTLELHARLDELRAELGPAKARVRDLESALGRASQLEAALRAAEQGRALAEQARERERRELKDLRARIAELERSPRPGSVVTLEALEAGDAVLPAASTFPELLPAEELRAGGTLGQAIAHEVSEEGEDRAVTDVIDVSALED